MTWHCIKTLLLVSIVLITGCRVQPVIQPYSRPDKQTRTIYLVGHGWHAGIVVKRLDIARSNWPELEEFSQMEHLEIGWGDKNYYTSPEPGPGLALRALFLPTSSVLHVVGFQGAPDSYFPHSEIIRIELTDPMFEQMLHHISESFSRDECGSAVQLGTGIYGFSRFYAAEEPYHLCRTCNTWTATTLKAAGCPVSPALTANHLMSQARRFGLVIQEKTEH